MGAYFVFFLTTVKKGDDVSIYLDMGARKRGDENMRIDWGKMEWGGGDGRMRERLGLCLCLRRNEGKKDDGNRKREGEGTHAVSQRAN